eukprot:498673-Pleurochrysis_carterae.AAC.1
MRLWDPRHTPGRSRARKVGCRRMRGRRRERARSKLAGPGLKGVWRSVRKSRRAVGLEEGARSRRGLRGANELRRQIDKEP